MKNLVENGVALQYTVSGENVKSGDVVVVGDIAGIAVSGGKVGETITLYIEGVYRLPKGAGALDQGKKVYAKVADGIVSIVGTAAGNTFVGYAWQAAAAADATVDVKLSY